MQDFEDAMLDVAWKNLESENNRFNDLDTKATGIITITGILITFLAKPTNSGTVPKVLFAATALLFLVTILLSVLVIRTRVAKAVSTEFLIEELKNEKPERQVRGIIGTIADVEKTLRDVCNTKADDLKNSIYSLGLSVVLLIFYSLSNFF